MMVNFPFDEKLPILADYLSTPNTYKSPSIMFRNSLVVLILSLATCATAIQCFDNSDDMLKDPIIKECAGSCLLITNAQSIKVVFQKCGDVLMSSFCKPDTLHGKSYNIKSCNTDLCNYATQHCYRRTIPNNPPASTRDSDSDESSSSSSSFFPIMFGARG
jgi:hypothetical protein